MSDNEYRLRKRSRAECLESILRQIRDVLEDPAIHAVEAGRRSLAMAYLALDGVQDIRSSAGRGKQ